MSREAVDHYNRGQRCSDRGDNEGARSAWEAALSVSTDGAAATVLLNLGQLHGRCGRIELCKQYTRRSIAADPNEPLAHCNLGSALSNGGSHAEALACAAPQLPPLQPVPPPHQLHPSFAPTAAAQPTPHRPHPSPVPPLSISTPSPGASNAASRSSPSRGSSAWPSPTKASRSATSLGGRPRPCRASAATAS